MSRENVERLAETIQAFNRLIAGFERSALDEWIEFYDPATRFEPQQASLQGGYSGHEGLRRWLADMAEHYGAGGHVDCAELRDVGDRVLAFGTLRYIGKGSGIETESPIAVVASFRDGLIIEFRDYGDRRQALEAVGLSD